MYVLSHLTTPRDSDVWRHATRQQGFFYLMVRHSLPCRGWSYLLPPLWCWGRWARLCSPPGCRVLHTPLRTSRWPHWPLLLSSHHFITLSRDDLWVDHCTKQFSVSSTIFYFFLIKLCLNYTCLFFELKPGYVFIGIHLNAIEQKKMIFYFFFPFSRVKTMKSAPTLPPSTWAPRSVGRSGIHARLPVSAGSSTTFRAPINPVSFTNASQWTPH